MTITIGGSEVAAVLNEGYGCSRALFYRKTGIESENPLTDDNPHIRRGHDMEPIIIGKFQEKHPEFMVISSNNIDLYVDKFPILQHFSRDERGIIMQSHSKWKLAHVDGLLMDSRGYIEGILECKAPGDRSFKTIKTEGLVIDYVLQLQYYLSFLVGNVKGYYAIHGCGENWEYLDFPVDVDPALDKIINEGCEAFITRVENNDIPEQLDEDDKRCGRCEYQKHCRGAEFSVDTEKLLNMGDDPDLDMILAEYEASKQTESDGRKAGDKSKEYRNLIKDMANGYSGLETRNYQAIIKVENGKTSVDTKKLAKIAPSVFAEVAKKGDPVVKIIIQKKGE